MAITGNKTTKKRNLGVLALAMAILALATGGTRSPAQTADERSGSCAPIEGSWIFEVTRINDPSTSFTAVASFTAGGVFLATGSSDHLNSPGPVSPLYGSWKRKERNLYISTTHFFAFVPVTGEAVAMLQAFQTFKLTSRNELVGVGETWACDVQGQNCQRTPITDITIKGTRIKPKDVTDLTLPPD